MRFRLIILFGIVGLCSCARYGNPTGGAKDESPPSFIKEGTEANYQTRFNKSSFIFEFDEWIKVDNPLKEVVVSPPTNYPYKVTGKGKKVIFEFSEEEVLKEDVTYQINFGKAIKDFTENNVLENFVFVFSTGDIIDSLSVKGKVVDVLEEKGKKDILVLLYDNLSDTAFTKTRPFYFTRTNATGDFELNNLRSDTFNIFALEDGNVNYFYDLPNEKVGFLDTLIVLNDSSDYNVLLELFDEEDPVRLVDYTQNKKGLINLNYQPIPNEYEISSSTDSTLFYTVEERDSLFLWHNDLASDSSFFYVAYDDKVDTIKNKKAKKTQKDLELIYKKGSSRVLEFHHSDSIEINFNKPLKTYDLEQVVLKDTSNSYSIYRVELKENKLRLWADSLKAEMELNLSLLPGAITDWYGQSINDTINISCSTYNPENFGNINLSFSSVLDDQYVVILTLKDKELDKFVIDADQKIELGRLKKGNYKLKIIRDTDGNGRWSTGNIKLKRQSEKIKEFPLEELKAGWDLELTVDFKEIFNDTSGE